MDQDKSDTTKLTDLYLGSQHKQDVTDQLRRYNQVKRPVSRNTVCQRSQDDQEQPEDQYRPMTPGEEERLRDTPEPSTPPVQSPPPPPPGPPLTPRAARITEEAVVDVVGEEQLPWLEEDVSSSETSKV